MSAIGAAPQGGLRANTNRGGLRDDTQARAGGAGSVAWQRLARHILNAATTSQWSSSVYFVAACTAAIIGLSGFWRLPFLVETYGGGAFLLVYILAVVLLGWPLLAGQLLLTRGTRLDLPGVMACWIRATTHSRVWIWCGVLAVAGASLLVMCYSVIGSWSMAYTLRGMDGLLGGTDLLQARSMFDVLAQDAEKSFGWQLLFIGLVAATSARGLRAGVAPVLRTLAVLIALLLLLLLLTVLWHADASAMAHLLLAPDFTELTWRAMLEALYQAFFTLSLGTGVIVALGSYLPVSARPGRLAAGVLVLTVLITLLAAFVFGIWLNSSRALLGSGLQQLFIVLPAVLDTHWQLTLIYLLVTLVALAAAIALLEPLTRLLQRRLRWSRLRAGVYAGVLVWLGGLAGLLSFGVLDAVRWQGMNIFDWQLTIAANGILPLVALAYSVFIGRVLVPERLLQAWRGGGGAGQCGFRVWHGLLRYPVRMVLLAVLFYALGGVAFVTWLWG